MPGCFLSFLAFGQILSAQDELRPGWQCINVGWLDSLAIRLCARNSASLTDEDWLEIQILNTGERPLKVRNAYYRMEAVKRDATTGKAKSSGGMASGNTYDLFPHAWNTVPASPVLIQPGLYIMSNQPSNYSAALLGMAPPGGLIVEAQFHLRLELQGQPAFSTPSEGVSFSFVWESVPPSAFDILQTRLSRLLRERPANVTEVYLMKTLLDIELVGDSLNAEQFLSAFSTRGNSLMGRRYIVEALGCRFPDHPSVIEFYRSRLREGDQDAIGDLVHEERIWDPALLGPMLEAFERSSHLGSMNGPLHILSRHRDEWPAQAILPDQLSRRVLAKSAFADDPYDNPDPQDMASYVDDTIRALAMTHDPSMIPCIRPFLDCRLRIIDLQFWAPPFILSRSRIAGLRCGHGGNSEAAQ